MVITMDHMEQALKTKYLSVCQSQINDKTTAFFAAIPKGSEDMTGKEAVFAMRYGRNGGTGARDEYGDLPLTNPRQTKQAKLTMKNIMARTMFTQKVIDASKDSAGSFVNVMSTELEEVMKDAKEQVARMLQGDGSGFFGSVTANSNSTTIAVDGIVGFAPGLILDIFNAAGDTLKYSQVYVSDVDYGLSTILVKTNPGAVVAGDKFCINGSNGKELTGLGKVFSADPLYGIDRSVNKWAIPIMINQNGAPSEITMQKVLDSIDLTSGASPNMLMCTKGVKRAYMMMEQAFKRNIDYMELKGGFTAMKFHNNPLVDDKYAPAGTMTFITLEDWKLHRLSDWKWADKSGSIFRPVANKLAWEAVLYCFCDIATVRPSGNGRLYGITEQ